MSQRCTDLDGVTRDGDSQGPRSSLTRRRLLAGGVAVGASGLLAGCSDVFGALSGGSSGETLTYGDKREGKIESGGPTDPIFDDLSAVYAFEGSRGDVARIRMASQELDSYVVLTRSDGSLVDASDDTGESRNVDFTVLLPASATYQIWAGSYEGDQTGSFTLSLSEVSDQLAGPPDAAATIAYGETVEGEITEDGPRDPRWEDLSAAYTFEGSRDDQVKIEMTAMTYTSFVVLSGPGGGVVAYTNDEPGRSMGPVEATLPVDGTYTIWAGSETGSETGQFSLTLSRE